MRASPRPAWWCLLAVAVAAVAPVRAQTEAAPWTLTRLMAEMPAAPKPTVRFVEERHLRLLSEPLLVEGTLRYIDGRLEKHTVGPEEEHVVIEGDRMRISAPGRNVRQTVLLSDFPALDTLISGLRDTLDGDIDALKRRFWVDFKSSGPEWRMTLTPLDAVAREDVRDVRIAGRQSRIASIEVTEQSGDRTVIRIPFD